MPIINKTNSLEMFKTLALLEYIDNFYKNIVTKNYQDFRKKYLVYNTSYDDREPIFNNSFLDCMIPTGEVWRLQRIERTFDDFKFHFYQVDQEFSYTSSRKWFAYNQHFSNEDARHFHTKIQEIACQFDRFNKNPDIFFFYSDLTK